MLHAINARKAVSIESASDTAKRHPREDLVTSALLGTIQFLEASERSRAIWAVTGEDEEFVSPRIMLWPEFRFRRKGTIPDVVIVESDGAPETRKIWIVEVKWGTSTQDMQISRQIQAVSEGKLRQSGRKAESLSGRLIGITLLGAKERHSDSRFSSTPWTSVTRRLTSLEKELPKNSGLRNWAESSRVFLANSAFGGVLGEWCSLEDVGLAWYSFGFPWPRGMAEVKPATYHFDMQQTLKRRR